MLNYHNYTSYARYVDFKRLDFMVQVVTEAFDPSITNARGLDLGCGEGNIAIPLASLGYKIVGVDLSPEALKVAEDKKTRMLDPRSSLKFFVGDAENLTIGDKLFDFVICTEVLEHLVHPEKALYSISNLMKDDGILILTVPNGYGLYSLIFDQLRNKIVSKIIPVIGRSQHIQSFTLAKIKLLTNHASFEFMSIKNSDFVSFLPFLVRSNGFCKIDCTLVNRLPPELASGWYFAFRKRKKTI